MKVLITGATGFVGRALCEYLGPRHAVRATVRSAPVVPLPCLQIVVNPSGQTTDWSIALHGQEVVIHLVARVHVMNEISSDPLADFRAVNVEGSLNLARQAAAAGVRRMVFISSVKVNGEYSRPGQAFCEDDVANPGEAYGISKLEAEDALQRLAAQTGLELVIVRPPLVYGPGVKANFRALMQAVVRGWPLPLGAVKNRRSLVGMGNLVHFIGVCIEHPAAAGNIFYVSDGEDISTPDLVRRMASAAQVAPRLINIPVWMLESAAAFAGRRESISRLCGDLQVDISKARYVLGWKPPVSVDEGLRQTFSLPRCHEKSL